MKLNGLTLKAKVGAGIALAALALACIPLASCAQTQATQSDQLKETTFSEGADAPCAVSYSEQEAPKDMPFLAEGDSIAVVSPSTLPSQEQVDATIKGLESWGYVPVEGKHVLQNDRTGDSFTLGWQLSD